MTSENFNIDRLERRVTRILSKHWWVLLLRGILALIFGLFTWFQPGITAATLVLLFGAFALSDGLFAVWQAFSGRALHDDWWVLLFEGLLGIGAGCLTFFVPEVTAFALLVFIAAWAIARGVLQVLVAIRIRKEIEGEWILILGGLASLIFGVILVTHPEAGALGLLWLIAFYAITIGIVLIALALRVKNLQQA